MSTVDLLDEIDYPESDGEPMGETELHQMWMIRIRDLLRWRYRGQRVYVGSDLLLYYVEGEPSLFVVPDDFVVKDCDPGMRRTFKTWEEGRAPDVVFEVTSHRTRRKDRVFKPQTYREIGVKELFLYDPTAEYLRPPLKGFRLQDGSRPAPILPDASGGLECVELGVLLRLESGRLEMFDAVTGERLLTEAEAERAARESEHAARQAAEEEVRRLRDELARRSSEGPGTVA